MANKPKTILPSINDNVNTKADTQISPKNSDTPSPIKLTKRIGGTIYKVSAFYSQTSLETLNDKVLRLIKNEIAS